MLRIAAQNREPVRSFKKSMDAPAADHETRVRSGDEIQDTEVYAKNQGEKRVNIFSRLLPDALLLSPDFLQDRSP